MGERWSEERVWEWYNSRPWMRGCNYMSADCANRIDQWQSLGFAERMETTEEELAKGGIPYDKLICTLDKAKACIDENISVLIDDLPANCAAAAEHGISAILFNSKANQNMESTFPRVSNWSEAVEEVAMIK